MKSNILKVGSKNLNTENWKVYHPNGTHMFTCGEKKATWYLERNLAIQTSDGKIILTFEPKGIGFEDNEVFGKSVREAICVVSGVVNELQRHHIVPYCYRTFFPEQYKSKNHHDVVLINYEKHLEYEKEATHYKDVIANIFNVKTISEYNSDYTNKLHELSKDNSIIINNLNYLFKRYDNIPIKVKLEKLKLISINTNIPFDSICGYNYIQLYKLYLLVKEKYDYDIYDFKQNKRKYYDHGFHIVKKLNSEKKIIDFVKLWRNHFINTMHPQFMPTGWSVDFRIKTII